MLFSMCKLLFFCKAHLFLLPLFCETLLWMFISHTQVLIQYVTLCYKLLFF
jgi:hypothetical protein